MAKNIFWTGYSSEERHAAISAIADIVSQYGDVVDFKLFSDISLSMVIEMEELNVDTLYDELAGRLRMDDFERLNAHTTRERTVYLNITFAKGSGDLIIEVPSVPG